MKKLAALFLSLALLIGCIGSAEVGTVNLDVTYMGQDLAHVMLMAGVDDDYCGVITVLANIMGQAFGGTVQAGSNALTVSDGIEAYTVTADALSEALATVVTGLIPAGVAASLAQINPEDLDTLQFVAMSEINRIAQIAMEQNIVSIDEDGDLMIYADADTVLYIAEEYLEQVAEGETNLSALVTTTLWTALGLPSYAMIQQYAAAIEEQLSGIYASDLGIDASVWVKVESEGSVNVNIDAKYNDNGIELYVFYDGEKFDIDVEMIANGETVAEYEYNYAPDRIYCEMEQGELERSLYATISDGVIYIDIENEDGDFTSELDLNFNLSSYELYGFISVNDNVNDEEVDFSGELQMEENAIKYVIDFDYDEDTHTAVIGAELAGTAYNGFLQLDNDVYTLSVNMADYTVTALVNGMTVATMGLYAIDENNVQIYVDVNGARYTATVTYADVENGAGYTLSLGAEMGGQTAEIAAVNVAVSSSSDTLPHTEGVLLSAEQISSLLISLIAAAM